jgi:hypothetical protein
MAKRKIRDEVRRFVHSSGHASALDVINEHALPDDLEPEDVETPHGYRARTVSIDRGERDHSSGRRSA